MNKIEATIVNIQRERDALLVKLNSKDSVFTILMLCDGRDVIKIGSKYNILFKESEVVISSKKTNGVSIRNKFMGRITNIEEDSILSRIFIDFNGVTITSLITKEAKDELELGIGNEIEWLVKSNELVLQILE